MYHDAMAVHFCDFNLKRACGVASFTDHDQVIGEVLYLPSVFMGPPDGVRKLNLIRNPIRPLVVNPYSSSSSSHNLNVNQL